MNSEFVKRRDYIYNELQSISCIEVNKPEGAFYIFPSIKKFLGKSVNSSFDFAEKLLEEKLVVLVPGEGFGAPGYIRLSYALGMDEITKGIKRIKKFLSEIQ